MNGKGCGLHLLPSTGLVFKQHFVVVVIRYYYYYYVFCRLADQVCPVILYIVLYMYLHVWYILATAQTTALYQPNATIGFF